jgi:hypothetical protein
MIKIILPNKTIISQLQIFDAKMPEISFWFKFQAIPKGGIMKKILGYFFHKQTLINNLKKVSSCPKIQFHSLYEYMKRKEVVLEPVKPHNQEDKPNIILQNSQALININKYCQKSLNSYITQSSSEIDEIKYRFIDRFRAIPPVTYEDFCASQDLSDDWIYFQEVEKFDGLFQHLILLNSFDYWDEVEAELRKKGFHPKGFSVQEIIKWDLLKNSSGVRFYTQFHNAAKSWEKSGLAKTFDFPENVPKPYHFSHYYSFLSSQHFKTYFLHLVEECIQYGIIIPHIAEADGIFIRSWAGNFTKDKYGNPTDPEATITVHNKKYYGKGFTTIAFYAWCGTRCLPVYSKTYTGSTNENRIYQEVMNGK